MTSVVRAIFPTLCLALFLAAFTASPVRAQGAYTDDKLESFVSAAIQVQNLMKQYQPQIQSEENPQRAETLRREAKAKMETAIIRTPGITIDEYSRIVEATQRDQALNDRVDRMYRAATAQ